MNPLYYEPHFKIKAAAPVTDEELTTGFTRARPQAVQEILESLIALGRA